MAGRKTAQEEREGVRAAKAALLKKYGTTEAAFLEMLELGLKWKSAILFRTPFEYAFGKPTEVKELDISSDTGFKIVVDNEEQKNKLKEI